MCRTGQLSECLQALIVPLPLYFSRLIHGAFDGMGTNDTKLIQVGLRLLRVGMGVWVGRRAVVGR